MKVFLFSIILFFSVTLEAKVNFTSFIDTQLKFVYAMNENNITQAKIKSIINEQEVSYNDALNNLMKNKNYFIEEPQLYDAEIFSLKKIMSINKRAGNKNAVLRDEIKLKSYRVLRNQNLMIKEILLSLNAKNIDNFDEDRNFSFSFDDKNYIVFSCSISVCSTDNFSLPPQLLKKFIDMEYIHIFYQERISKYFTIFYCSINSDFKNFLISNKGVTNEDNDFNAGFISSSDNSQGK